MLFSGTANLAARKAQGELAEHYGVGAELWSATSYTKLRSEALSVDRWNRFHPEEPPRSPFVTRSLSDAGGPIVAVSDFMKMVPDQIARYVPGAFVVLGTDGRVTARRAHPVHVAPPAQPRGLQLVGDRGDLRGIDAALPDRLAVRTDHGRGPRHEVGPRERRPVRVGWRSLPP